MKVLQPSFPWLSLSINPPLSADLGDVSFSTLFKDQGGGGGNGGGGSYSGGGGGNTAAFSNGG